MPRKKEPTIHNPKPACVIKHTDSIRTEIYVLRNERWTMDFRPDDHAWRGPAIVTRALGPWGMNDNEYHPDNASFWEWIGKLAQEGNDALNEADH
jgi:hypothetical protein